MCGAKIFIGAGCRTGVDVGVGAEFGNTVVIIAFGGGGGGT